MDRARATVYQQYHRSSLLGSVEDKHDTLTPWDERARKNIFSPKNVLPCLPLLISNILVRPMLYGFGDSENPRQDTVELVEELVIEYISDVV